MDRVRAMFGRKDQVGCCIVVAISTINATYGHWTPWSDTHHTFLVLFGALSGAVKSRATLFALKVHGTFCISMRKPSSVLAIQLFNKRSHNNDIVHKAHFLSV